MRKLVILGIAAFALACSSGGAGTPMRSAASGGRNVLTIQEVRERAADVSNAYEALERLRPDFLRTRGPVTLGSGGSAGDGGISVYINTDRQPTLESIKMVPVSELKEIRKLSASEAQTKFGLNNMAGAIQVITVRQ
jgi:hypothetical protein